MASVCHIGLFNNGLSLVCLPEYPSTFNEQLSWIGLGSLQEAMDAVWRVKEWAVNVSGGTLDSYTNNAAGKTESDLVCEYLTHQASGEFGTGDIEEQWSWHCGPSISYDGGTYYLNMLAGLGDGQIFGEFPASSSRARVGYLAFEFVSEVRELTITVQPSLWWPYDPGDGLGPIYDTSTGLQIRSF